MDTRWRRVSNVLLIRLDSLGDVLVTTPAIHAVRDTLPDARLTLLCSPVGAQAARLNPDVDEAIVYRAPWMDASGAQIHDAEHELKMIDILREKQFDAAIIFTSYHQSSLPAAYLCYLAGIPLRHAASVDGPGSLLTSRYRHPPGIRHEVEHGLNLVGDLGFVTEHKDLVLRTRPDDEARGAELLARAGIMPERLLVVIHPGCSVQARTYPWGNYVQVADLLVERLDAQVVFTGMPDEAELVQKIRSWTRATTFSIAGQTDLGAMAAIISRADIAVTNNTGPMHIAAAMKTPVVALFALTNPPQQWGPWMVPSRVLNKAVPCAYCYSRTCPVDHECLKLVSEEEVVGAAESLLRETEGLKLRGRAAPIGSS